MNRRLVVAGLLWAVYGFAQTGDTAKSAGNTAPPTPGPAGRKSKDEAKVKKEVTAFLKQEEEIAKKGDFEASVARIDFPVFMLTDNAAGIPSGEGYTKDQYVKMMKPMWDSMPKDMQTSHNYALTVLSDAMVGLVDTYTTKIGKEKMTAKNMELLVKRNGEWKWKTMIEAGWGDTPEPGAASPSAAPAPAASPKK
jgi:hypothetical protein